MKINWKNLGDKFQEEILSGFEFIESNPNKFQIRYEAVRVYFLKKFPFGIHYVLSENSILITGIFHTPQNPDKWKNPNCENNIQLGRKTISKNTFLEQF